MELTAVQVQAGHWSAADEQLYCASRVFVSFYSSLFLCFIIVIIITVIVSFCFNY